MVERIEDIPEDVLVRVLGSRQRKQVSRPSIPIHLQECFSNSC